MNFTRVFGVRGAWLLVAALASCAHKQSAAERQQSAAEQSQSAFQAAAQDQRELAEQQKRLEAAHNAVVAAQQQLAQAQVREDQERSRTQELQQRVSQHMQQAQQRAQQAQAEAEQAQGIQSVAGQVMLATPSHVVLQAQGGRTYTFNVDQRTRVLVGTEQRSISDVQRGADAQVAYDPRAGQPTALTIRVTPAGSQTNPAKPVESPPPPAR
jgi:hypothetical protein